MTNKHISLAPVPASGAARTALAEALRTEAERAEAARTEERTKAISMWQLGYDTKAIASLMGHPESYIYNNLWKWRQAAKSEASHAN